MIGLFVIISLALFMTAIVIFGGNKFFARENLVITYFEGSLDGLNVGAEVTYRGVTIGQVKAINIHIRANDKNSKSIIIPVIISLSAGASLIVDGPEAKGQDGINIFMEAMCEQGLRAKLKLKSVVTGKRYIDLAFYENSAAVYRDTAGEYFEIPTLPSEMQQFSKIMGEINLGQLYYKFNSTLNSLEKLTSGLAESFDQKKTQQLLDDLLKTTASLNSILTQLDTEVSPILQKIDGGLEQFTRLTNHTDTMITSLDKQMRPLANDLKTTFSSIGTTLQQADTLLIQVEKTISPTSPLHYRFTQAVQQIEETARSIEKLSDFIHRNPDALIFGLQNSSKTDHNN